MSEKILIIGKNSKIAKEFIKKISKSVTVMKPSKTEWDMKDINFDSNKINSIYLSFYCNFLFINFSYSKRTRSLTLNKLIYKIEYI